MRIEQHTDFQAFVDYALNTFDFDERFEDDCFVADFQDVRWYVERKARWFVVHVGDELVRLPRC